MFGNSALLDTDDCAPVATGPAARRIDNRTCGKTRVGLQKNDISADWVACLRRIRDDRDEAAFVEVFRHFAPRVKAFLMRSGADEALAEECVQEVMATVWHKAALFDPARASVATWIFTIARNRKIDVLRKQRHPEPEELFWGPEADPDQADVIGLQQETAQLGEAIASLPEKQRALIEKAYYGDLSHSEIAEQTGLPLGTIKSRIRLALDRLRHTMNTN
jgi:RNA polymerase sigma factor (sigma-70 family)